MLFKEFNALLQANFADMIREEAPLFEVDVDKDSLWNKYLDAFPTGTNNIYRKRREFDCGCCRHFVKSIGNVVSIENGKIRTVWDFQTNDPTFQPVIDALAVYVRSRPIVEFWISKQPRVGTPKSFEQSDSTVLEWNHFFLDLPRYLVDKSDRSIGDLRGGRRDARNVFKRSLDEISQGSLLTILELVGQNSLYKGEEWKGLLSAFLGYKKAYDKFETDEQRELFAWSYSSEAGDALGRIRNHSIGTLLLDVSAGIDLDTAVRKYEAIVAPTNYKRPKAIFTQRMLDEAKKTIENLGYLNALGRRHATLDDISVNNILFSNRDSAKRLEGVDVFTDMAKGVPIDPKKFSRVDEISAEAFVNNILPGVRELEVLLENRHTPNLVSLIAPVDKTAPSMFKWNNAFGWAYSGNITDSGIKDRVKSVGGRVDGVLRFSIQWNDLDEDHNDLDAHCRSASGVPIYYANRHDNVTGGTLDVDIQFPVEKTPAVENITWASKSRMKPGEYRFYVHNFAHRGGEKGFRAEIEFDGQVFSYNFARNVVHKETIPVATVRLSSDGVFSIEHRLPNNPSSRDIWGVKTNQFIPASVVMFSPNYWDQQSGIGHRHYFFMLKDCVNPETPNGFYNEFLKEELLQHKRVFEALGNRMSVAKTNDQLSGVGFSSTKRDDLIVRVKGMTERVLKIKI